MGQDSKVVADGADDLEVFRKIEFPELTREQFLELKAWAEVKGYNIKSGHVCARLEPIGRDRYRLVPLIRIDGMRAKAHATLQLGDIIERPVKYQADGTPDIVKVIVCRRIGGVVNRYPGYARWSNFYPGKGISPFWDKMRELMLVKCAEAQAYRRAFPEELGGAYCPEEMERDLLKGQRLPESDNNLIEREDGTVLDLSTAQ